MSAQQNAAATEQQQQQNESVADMMGARRSVVMRFTFVRHGETQANKDRCIQGHTDIPLCQSGEEQASRAGERLKDVRFSRVYASDLCRASATCRLILAKNTRHPPPLIIDTRLRERNFGSVEGLGFEEVLKMAEANGSSWPQYSPPGAESLGDVQGRLVAFFKEICQSIYDKNNNNLKKKETAEESGKASKDVGQTLTNKKKKKEDEEEEEEEKKKEEADMEEENMLNEAKEKEEKERKKEPKNDAKKTERGREDEEEGEGGEEEHVLVVSHGAALRQLYLHLHRTLGCPLPPNVHPDTPARLSPNTGISTYSVQYSPKTYTLQCLCLHESHHLQGM